MDRVVHALKVVEENIDVGKDLRKILRSCIAGGLNTGADSFFFALLEDSGSKIGLCEHLAAGQGNTAAGRVVVVAVLVHFFIDIVYALDTAVNGKCAVDSVIDAGTAYDALVAVDVDLLVAADHGDRVLRAVSGAFAALDAEGIMVAYLGLDAL